MSTVATAKAGRYTLTIEDATNTSTLDARVRMSGLQPQFGELGRGRGQGILPSNFSAIIEDTKSRDLRALFEGSFTEDNYPVSIQGPPLEGNGTPFHWRGWVRSNQTTKPINREIHPEIVQLNFYDGLTRLKNDTDLYGGQTSFTTIINEAFDTANSNLDISAALRVAHEAGQYSGFGDQSFGSIYLSDSQVRSFNNRWDALNEICRRYQARAFLDPYHHDANGNPTWHLDFRGIIGLQHTNHKGNTVSSQTINIQENSGTLSTRDGNEIQSATVRSINEQLGDGSSNDPVALFVNGKQALRDGNFQITNTSDEPVYGDYFGTLDASGVPNGVKITDGGWQSERYYTGDITPLYVRLTFDARENLSGSDITVELEAVEPDGSTTLNSSTTTSPGNGQTLSLTVNQPVDLRVDVDATDVCEFANATLEVDTLDFFTDDSIIDFVKHNSEQKGLLEKTFNETSEVLLDVSGPNLNLVPASGYTNQETNVTRYRAGAHGALTRLSLQSSGTNTLRSTIKDKVLGPRTRIIVENNDGTSTHYQTGSGRRITLKDEYTELADITVPDYR